MISVAEAKLASRAVQHWLAWLPVLAGLAALYVPTIIRLANGLWNEEAYVHGPIVGVVFIWLVWRKRSLFQAQPEVVATWAGTAFIAGGLLLYIVGRSQSIIFFEVGSVIPVLVGLTLLLRGWRGLSAMWFPLVFLLFLVPLPGFVVDAITGPLKEHVSDVVEGALYSLGYPIGRNGVVLSIGSYQLLIADACSGLNSMFSLAAFGMLYLHIVPAGSPARNALVFAGILPIAFAANIVRVILLVLITYHLGDEAGENFLHGLSGMVLFVAALLMLTGWDFLVQRLLGVKPKEKH